MKNVKSLVALLLAISFTTAPLGFLQACSSDENVNAPEHSLQAPTDTETNTENNENSNDSVENGDNTQTPEIEPEPMPEPEPEPILPSVTYAKYIKCTGNSVNIRSGAGTSYTALGVAEKNTSYAVIGQSGNWYKTYYRGKTAYIYATYTAVFEMEESKNEDIEEVIEEGYKLIGVPYVYGAVRFHDGKGKLLAGFSAQKFDCSSLIQYIFYQGAGKILDVNTRTQVKQGKYVAVDDLQRGDCLFFTNESRQHLTGVERVGHVALYLGNNYILHTASDYARIEKISASRWNFYIEARRFI